MKNFNKIITLILVTTFVFSPILATKASAQLFVPTWSAEGTVTASNEVSDTLTNLGWDGLLWLIVNLTIERMAADTVNWINSGFKGSPAFVTDPEAYFADLGDKVAGHYIFSNPNLSFLCGPISAKIRLALNQNYTEPFQWRCTLTEVGKNLDNFMSDFENGGWDSFFELTQRRQNSPLGAYLQAEEGLRLQIASKKGTREKELADGNGFLSFKRCKVRGNVAASVNPVNTTCAEYGSKEPGGPIVCLKEITTINDVSGQIAEDVCVGGEETVTPGSVISEQLNKQLGLGQDKLAVADEINEIVSALLNQLVGKIVGGIGSGLRGLSRPDSEGRIFINQLSTEEKNNKIENYRKETEGDLEEFLNLPPYDPYLCRDNPSLPECVPPGSPEPEPCDPITNPSCPQTP